MAKARKIRVKGYIAKRHGKRVRIKGYLRKRSRKRR